MKVLASDFDNTLFVDDINILKKNIMAINKFIKNGNIFCIITGRNYSDIKLLLNKYNISYSYLICQDGAKVFDNLDFCIRSILLEENKINIISKILDDNNYKYFLDDGYNKTNNINDCVKVVSFYEDRKDAIRVVGKISKSVDVYIYISREHINIMNSSVNKSSSLKWLIEKENYLISDIYVIGDEVNDLEMLSEFNGAVMKNHSKELDFLGKEEYEALYQYIEELSKY